MNNGRTIVRVGNSGITWYWYSYPILRVVIVLPALSCAVMMYVTFVPYGNVGMLAFQMFLSRFDIAMFVHTPLLLA